MTKSVGNELVLLHENMDYYYSSCASSGDEKRAVMNPKELRFTQSDIAPRFQNTEHPSVQDAVGLILQRRLDPAVFGELTVHRDKEEKGVVWCENNRRLYVLRKAGVESVRVKFKNNDFKSISQDKKQLNDPAFMPRIRGGTSTDQIPDKCAFPVSSSSYEEKKETSSSLAMVGAGVVAAGYAAWKLFNLFTQSDHDQNANADTDTDHDNNQ